MPCPKQKKCPVGSIPYIVREGDTLLNIATIFNTSVDKILMSNVNLNPYNLNVGQTLCIPFPASKYPQCQTTNYYIAQEGDTFFSIGKKFGVATDDIVNANLGVMPENIYTGILLCIPVAPSPVCITTPPDGSKIIITDAGDGKERTFKSRLNTKSLLVPGKFVLTKKRLTSGDIEGAKELLFSPFEFGIRGESQMDSSTSVFIETDNSSMLEIFNLCPVGTMLEVVK